MPQERNIQATVLRFLRAVSGCAVRKLHVTQFGTAGDPDLYGCYRGRMFVVELKQEGKQPTPLQSIRLQEWQRAGAVTIVAHSIEELRQQWAEAFLDPQREQHG